MANVYEVTWAWRDSFSLFWRPACPWVPPASGGAIDVRTFRGASPGRDGVGVFTKKRVLGPTPVAGALNRSLARRGKGVRMVGSSSVHTLAWEGRTLQEPP